MLILLTFLLQSSYPMRQVKLFLAESCTVLDFDSRSFEKNARLGCNRRFDDLFFVFEMLAAGIN